MQDKSLRRMATPLVLSFTLRFIFTFVDLGYARFLRDDNAAVAAIGFYMPFHSVFVAVWVGLSAGFTASLSRAFGRRDQAEVKRLKRGILRILFFLIPGLVLLGAIVYTIAPHLGLEPALAEAFRTYATTLMVGMPLTGFWAIYPDSIVKAHQDTVSTMIAGLTSTITNVGLNTLFVFGFHWGILGIALGTVLSRLPGLAYALWRARALERRRQETLWSPVESQLGSPVRLILVLAIPGAITNLLTAVEMAAANRIMTGVPESTSAIASWGVYQQMLNLSLMPVLATSIAVIPYTARLLPRGQTARIRRELVQVGFGIAAVSLVMTTLMGWVFAEPLTLIFIKETSAGAVGLASTTLHFLPLAMLATTPFLLLRPVFEAAQQPRIGILLSLVRFTVLALPLMFGGQYLATKWGYSGLHGMIGGIILATGVASTWTIFLVRTLLRQPPS